MKAVKYAILCLCLFAGVVMATLGLSALQISPTATAPELVAHYEGEGDFESEPFTVSSGWEIRWDHDGEIKQIEWNSAESEGDLLMSLPHKPIREHGGVNLSSSGTYELKVIANGPWSIDIWQYPQ